jgi:chromosome segregation ATPase
LAEITDEKKKIETGELAFLQEHQVKLGHAQANLGATVHQIKTLEQHKEKLHAEIDHLNREYEAVSARLTKKYDLKPNTAINLQNGEYEG